MKSKYNNLLDPAAEELLNELNKFRKFKRFFTIKEVADFFSVSERTVREWIARGKLYAVKPAQNWLIPRGAIEDIIKNRTNLK